ncbi:MAG: PilZ domain-containing protein, partial [Actinomycetia bacterium]|nr:PilZ domain-containing protein [Actinomycetes bacterium]
RPVLAKLFSGRQTFRATPRILQPIIVEVVPPADAYVSAITVEMLDVSTTGLALLVPFDFEEEMAGYDVLMVTLALPGGGKPMEMAGIIRNRHAEPDGVRYGIEFYKKGTDRFQNKLEYIIRFVMDRKLEQLDEWDDPTSPGYKI